MHIRGFFSLSILTLTAVLLTGTARLGASNTVTPPTAEFIMAALRNQETLRSSSLKVVYDTTAGKGNRSSSLRVTYIQTPDILYSEDVNAGVETVKVSYDRKANSQTKLYAHPGELPTGEVLRGIGRPFTTQNFVETTRYQIHEGPLCDVIQRGKVADTQEPIDGSLCWRVTVPSTKAAIKDYTVWVDPEIGFCPRQVNVAWKDSAPQVISFRNYRQVSPDVWFPMEHVVEHAKQDGILRVTSRVVSAEVGMTIPREELLVTFPPKTTVWQQGAEKYVVP